MDPIEVLSDYWRGQSLIEKEKGGELHLTLFTIGKGWFLVETGLGESHHPRERVTSIPTKWFLLIFSTCHGYRESEGRGADQSKPLSSMHGQTGAGLILAAQTVHQASRQARRTETEEARVVQFLERFPEFSKTLRLAVVYEENAATPLRGWRWHDVETHPTKLIRLVTDGIARVGVKTRGGTYYLLRDREAVKKIFERPAGSEGPSD